GPPHEARSRRGPARGGALVGARGAGGAARLGAPRAIHAAHPVGLRLGGMLARRGRRNRHARRSAGAEAPHGGHDPRSGRSGGGGKPAAITLCEIEKYEVDLRPQPVGLVGSVGTLPAHRRRGLARWLVTESLARSRRPAPPPPRSTWTARTSTGPPTCTPILV